MLENNHLHMLCFSLILRYTSGIWENTYKFRLHTSMLLQKMIIHHIAEARCLGYTHPFFVKYKCLKILYIVNLKTLIIIYEVKHNILIYKAMFVK